MVNITHRGKEEGEGHRSVVVNLIKGKTNTLIKGKTNTKIMNLEDTKVVIFSRALDCDYEFVPMNHVIVAVLESGVSIGFGDKLPRLVNLLEWFTFTGFLGAVYLVPGVPEAEVCGFDIATTHRTAAVFVVEKAVKNPAISVTPLNK